MTFNIGNLVKPCETCGGTTMLIQDEGVTKGMVRPCTDCIFNYKKFINQYGSDQEDGVPDVYIDSTSGVLKKIDRKKDYLLLPNGTEIDLSKKISLK